MLRGFVEALKFKDRRRWNKKVGLIEDWEIDLVDIWSHWEQQGGDVEIKRKFFERRIIEVWEWFGSEWEWDGAKELIELGIWEGDKGFGLKNGGGLGEVVEWGWKIGGWGEKGEKTWGRGERVAKIDR